VQMLNKSYSPNALRAGKNSHFSDKNIFNINNAAKLHFYSADNFISRFPASKDNLPIMSIAAGGR